mmetsp:Transcript_52030/g.129582  ORF Transcript_52030/g.129582 Transcript_52030/m.129582 type:complete len:207 (-) Transcript_52030:226-846(-)
MTLMGDAPWLNISLAERRRARTRSALASEASKSAVRSMVLVTMPSSSLAPSSPDWNTSMLNRIFMNRLTSAVDAVPMSFLICVATAFCASVLPLRSLVALGHSSAARNSTALPLTDASVVMSSSRAVVVARTSCSRAVQRASVTTTTSLSFSDRSIWARTPTSLEMTAAVAEDAMCLKLSMAFMRYASPSSKRSMRMSRAASAWEG